MTSISSTDLPEATAAEERQLASKGGAATAAGKSVNSVSSKVKTCATSTLTGETEVVVEVVVVGVVVTVVSVVLVERG